MQTVQIPKTKKKPQRSSKNAQTAKSPRDNNDKNDPWSFDPWASDPWGSSSEDNGAKPSKKERLSPQDRVKMIGEVYKSVLGRDPDTRDINYYKYSTLGRDEIVTQLLDGKEHKKLVEEGTQFTKLKNRAEQAEIRSKVLENQIKDQIGEFKELTHLLDEKNRQIQALRRRLNNPYDFTEPAQEAIRLNEARESTSYSNGNGEATAKQNQNSPVFTEEVRPVKPPKQSFLSFVMEKLKELVSI